MKRLTRKITKEELKEGQEIGEPFCREYEKDDYCELEGTYDRDRLNKLGQIEDIEEELGIDLITLFKALKNGVYSNHYAYAGEETHKIDVELEKRPYGFCISGGFGEGHNLKDYGKTWALTKEELEK